MEQSSNNGSPTTPQKNNIIEGTDYELQLPAWSTEGLRAAAMEHSLFRPRSLAWAILLGALPPPNGNIVKSLGIHRQFYNDLRCKLSKDPRAVIGDDPLSQNDESAWKQHFCDNELKALILQDVVRTFPDEAYFRNQDVQDLMVRVLFHWARAHPAVGYRQGMHEVLAPLLYEVHNDREHAPDCLSDDTLKCYLDDAYLEHDSYTLFSAVMGGLERFYTTGDAAPSAGGRLPTSKAVHNPNEVVRYLEGVREEFLVPSDAELAARLANSNITMELFGIRWLRLLFGREFPRPEIPHLWGFLFADGPRLPHIHYVIVAMLISIRTTLLDPEPAVVLAALMRPAALPARHVCALARHLRRPRRHPRPPPPPPLPPRAHTPHTSPTDTWTLEHLGSVHPSATNDSGSEGVPEGSDVARELAALALVRAQLPAAASALARALPRAPPEIAQPLQQILQLAALLQCRNHALVDVETALEAAEGQSTESQGRRHLVPVSVLGGKRPPVKPARRPVNRVREVQLKVFHQTECVSASDLPSLDPLRLRTE